MEDTGITRIVIARCLCLLFFVLAAASVNAQQPARQISGEVVNEQRKPLAFASVQVAETGQQLTTNASGLFSMTLPAALERIHITVSFVGRQTVDSTITLKTFKGPVLFVLKELSLTLEGVRVTAVQKTLHSSSSILFDREAIEQSQAFSITDILNNLPGKQIKAPDLHNVQTLTLRTEATDRAAMNNSLGTAIIVDDIVQSNNANMQNKSLSMYSLGLATVSHAGRASFDVPFSGLDLRDIPVNNIEKIEVISGIPSAKYGDITSGAVIIDRQAGSSPYQFSVSIGGYSTQYSLSKGFNLGRKWGALNLSVNQLNSNENPTSSLQSYQRTNGGLIWTRHFSDNIKNTLSVNYSFRDDDIKQDPEDNTDKRTFVKSRQLSVTNRTAITLRHSWLNSINLSMGYSKGSQESYTQYAMNGQSKGIGDKDTTGIYEGYYIPGIYTAVDHVKGTPVNANVNLHVNGDVTTGNILHRLSAGGSLYISGNNGQGVIVDPRTPRFTNQKYQNQRPYAFDLLPAIVNTGYFVEDAFDVKVRQHTLSVTAGLRYDIQNGWGAFQPRINTAYRFNERWQLTAGYGLATKAPTMAYRYPAPAYFDVPVLQVYDPSPAKRVYLVYTEKVMPDNSQLKPMRANQLELGLKYNDRFVSSSLFFYYKHNKDGFATRTDYRFFRLPVYDHRIENDRLVYWQTDSTSLKTGMSQNQVVNATTSKDLGMEWFISTGKIKPIATSLSMVSSFSYSRFSNANVRLREADINLLTLYNVWYGIYGPDDHNSLAFTSKLTTTTHIPKLGFILNMAADFFWLKQRRNKGGEQYPIGYVDLGHRYYPINTFDVSNPIHNGLGVFSDTESNSNDPMYLNIHLQVAKEIKKKIRFSVRAYNVLNIIKRKYMESGSVQTFTDPVSLTGEISIKF